VELFLKENDIKSFDDFLPFADTVKSINFLRCTLDDLSALTEFKKLKTYQVDYIYPDMNNNGAFMLNGAIMSATLGSLVECTPFGTVKQIIEINRETEIEDIAYYNGKFYFAVLTQKPNKRHQVDERSRGF